MTQPFKCSGKRVRQRSTVFLKCNGIDMGTKKENCEGLPLFFMIPDLLYPQSLFPNVGHGWNKTEMIIEKERFT
jgi:hypothetical protein